MRDRAPAILAIAALRFEAAAWAPYADGLTVRVTVGGVGRASGEYLARWLRRGRPRLVIGFGVCGGLDPGALPGSIAVPAWTAREGGPRRSLAPLDRLAASSGLWTSATVVTTPEGKRQLAVRSGARWVDQEAAWWAEACHAEGIPLAVVKVVLDAAETALPAWRRPASWLGAPRVVADAVTAWRHLRRLGQWLLTELTAPGNPP